MLVPTLSPQPLPFPLGELPTRARRTYLARGAIALGLSELGLPRGALALMPAYHHGVEVEAVRAAGLEVEHYRIDLGLQVDLDDLLARMDRRAARLRVVYLTHFAGFPGPARLLRAECDRRGLTLLEDCALAFGSALPDGQPLGSIGDLSVFCLYKSVPVPHGGVLVSPHCGTPAPFRERLAPPPAVATLAHVAGSLLRRLERTGNDDGWLLRASHAVRQAMRTVPTAARLPVGTQHLRKCELSLTSSDLVGVVLRRLPYPAIVARRRRNYERLRRALLGQVGAVTGTLPLATCPLFFAAWVPDRELALRRLAAARIEAIDLWRSGYEDRSEFPEAQALRRHVIELPCHQDLDDDDVDRMAAVLAEVA
jgi:dTDP-4-amino-4,6-dideoxygalactose transaminase